MKFIKLTESINNYTLKNSLYKKANELLNNRVINLKVYEIAFQDIIEKLYPNKAWWEVTDCNIFMDLLNNKSPMHTVEQIIKDLKIDNINEGIWSLPDNEDKINKLNSLLSKPLKAKNAPDLLYDLLGGDDLFDSINSECSPNEDCRWLIKSYIKQYLDDNILDKSIVDKINLNENFNNEQIFYIENDNVYIKYYDLPIGFYGKQIFAGNMEEPPENEYIETYVDYEYKISIDDVVDELVLNCISDDEYYRLEKHAADKNIDDTVEYVYESVKNNIEKYLDEYSNEILQIYRDYAIEDASEYYGNMYAENGYI